MSLVTPPTTQQGATWHLQHRFMNTFWKCRGTVLYVSTKRNQAVLSSVTLLFSEALLHPALCSVSIAGSLAGGHFKNRADIIC